MIIASLGWPEYSELRPACSAIPETIRIIVLSPCRGLRCPLSVQPLTRRYVSNLTATICVNRGCLCAATAVTTADAGTHAGVEGVAEAELD
jgi:hypothetical protein